MKTISPFPDAKPVGTGSTSRILVVDDEQVILEALTEMLGLEGYQVVAKNDPKAALDQLEAEPFAVILSDQKMPGLTGLEFLAEAKRLQPNAIRLLVTGVLSLDTVIDAINRGEIYRFIVKPWLREELLVAVRNAIQRHELTCRNAALQESTAVMNQELQAQVAQVGRKNQELARLNQTLEENLRRSLELCLRTLEAFFPPLGCQARRVRELCLAMAEVNPLSPPQKQAIEISAWLCDLGLIGTPRSLLKRWQFQPASLTEAEQLVLRQHPVLGEELARFAQPLAEVGPVIRAHHERFDGGGYPDGLEAGEIPWLARLLAVAVGYAESNRDPAAAAEAVRLASGGAYDPEAVRIFLRALPRASVQRKQYEVLLSELRPGMLLAKGIYTANGLLLVPEGQRLTETSINKVLSHNRLNPIHPALVVYC